MTETIDHALPKVTIQLPPALATTVRDPALLLKAAGDWDRCRDTLRELVGSAPGMRASLRLLLQQQLGLDAEKAGLQYAETTDRPASFVSLVELAAVLTQHSATDALTLDAQLDGFAPNHPMAQKTPQQLVEQLQTFNARSFILAQWDNYWNGRAPGSGVSRRELAARQFKTHLHCACQLTYAQGVLDTEQLQPLQALLDGTDGPATSQSREIRLETISLLPWEAGAQRLPGALVITRSVAGAAEQLLFLPGRTSALTLLSDRTALETWLLQHKRELWPAAATRFSTSDSIGYGPQTQGLAATFLELVERLRHNMVSVMRGPADSNLPHAASQALVSADSFDQTRSQYNLLAAPPTLELDGADATPAALFGALYAQIDFSARQASIKQQRDAFEALLADDVQGDAKDRQLLTLKTAIQSLENHQTAATAAATTLLEAQIAQDLYDLRQQPNAHYDALYHARREGLRAEADIQYALAQLSDAELSLCKSVLDAPSAIDRLNPDAVATSLSLQLASDDDESVITHELDGVLIITHQGALQEPASEHSLLLYWPGLDGGLQRFASLATLQRELLVVDATDRQVTLVLAPLRGDALAYGLQQQLYRCEQQAVALLGANSATQQADNQAEALELLRETTLRQLQIPRHAARQTAYAQMLEQNRSSALHAQLPGWLKTLPIGDRKRLKDLIQRYVPAIRAAQALLEEAIPARDDFTHARVQARLRSQFDVSGVYTLSFDLPNTVDMIREPIAGSGAPGTPVKERPQASEKRTTYTLEQLAQINLDDDLRQRYAFVRLGISGGDAQGRERLAAGFDFSQLQALVSGLDLAAAYTQRIRDAFMGAVEQAPFIREHQREQLLEPTRLMLQMQAIYALHRGLLTPAAQQILNTAIDANSRAAYGANGQRIVLRAARFSAGGGDTDERGTTLSGVTFIEEQVSGQTLIYLPDDPKGRYLWHYPSLDEARRALFQLTLDNDMADYLAECALFGDKTEHLARIREAHERNYDHMIAIGATWPQSTSLANHLLDAQMGRVIEAHRRSSRSNDELYLENFAIEREYVFDYIKMALGMVPFVGTVIGIKDGLDAAGRSIKALFSKDLYQGLVEFESVMLSLIDAAMDLVPGAGIVGVRHVSRQRHLRALPRVAGRAKSLPGENGASLQRRFQGYEYPDSINLSNVQPATVGIYRDIYRHADGDFIHCEGRTYQVELHDSPRTWRLKGTSSKTYKQPITLDEAGQWDTHGAVYGTLVNGGLAGGGGVLGHLADGLDPLWPQSLRQLLPRWWTDRGLRRQLALRTSIQRNSDELVSRAREVESLQTRLQAEHEPAQALRLDQQLDEAIAKELRLIESLQDEMTELEPVLRGAPLRNLQHDRSRYAALYVDRTVGQLIEQKYRGVQLLDEIDAAGTRLQAMAHFWSPAHQALMQQKKQLRIELLKLLDGIGPINTRIETWRARVSVKAMRDRVDARIASANAQNLHKTTRLFLMVSNMIYTITRYDVPKTISWLHLQIQAKKAAARMDVTFDMHSRLPEAKLNIDQRRRFLEQCIGTYQDYARDLRIWSQGYPTLMDSHYVGMLQEGLQHLTDLASEWIKRLPKASDLNPPRRGAAQQAPRMFETEDHRLLLGAEHASNTAEHRFTLTGEGGRTEIYVQGEGGRWRLQNPAPVTDTGAQLSDLIKEATTRIDGVSDYIDKVRGYARQNMAPVDLEHLLVGEAKELELRAAAIEGKAVQHEQIATLRSKADELRGLGQELRVQQSLASPTPTAGYLDYLLGQNVVQISSAGPRIRLPALADGRADFLQEYAVHDVRGGERTLVWYAHFHYPRAAGSFGEFTKAHLKLPAQRKLGLQWQLEQHAEGGQVQRIWRGDISRPMALTHFASL